VKYKLFETVVLERNLPQHRLRRGTIGAIVELYEPDGLEVEFFNDEGETLEVMTLDIEDVRPANDDERARKPKRGPDHVR
jgi:hypothetical protein